MSTGFQFAPRQGTIEVCSYFQFLGSQSFRFFFAKAIVEKMKRIASIAINIHTVVAEKFGSGRLDKNLSATITPENIHRAKRDITGRLRNSFHIFPKKEKILETVANKKTVAIKMRYSVFAFMTIFFGLHSKI